MAKKCESCRRSFFQSGGYMPCSCKNIEPKPEFVPPPPLETIGAGESKSKPSNMSTCESLNEVLSMLKTLWFLVIGFALGYLYATSYVS